MKKGPILEVRGLSKAFATKAGLFAKKQKHRVLDEVDLTLARGEILGIVGPSGSGKSTLLKCLINIEQPDRGTITLDGRCIVDAPKGVNLYADPRQCPTLRKAMQIILQNPSAALDEKCPLPKLFMDTVSLHHPKRCAKERAQIVKDTLSLCGLREDVLHQRPSQLSGGQKQRLCIARALLVRPHILLCDEITASLDVSIQAQILNLLLDLREELNLSMIFISHDDVVVNLLCDRTMTMASGTLVPKIFDQS